MLEQLDPSQWERCPGAVSDTYMFRDVDGSLVRRVEGSTFLSQRRLQWRVPVLIGTRGADAFWWYRNAVYRCERGLASWDIEALSPTAARRFARRGAPPAVMARPRAAREHPVRHVQRYVREHGLAATADKVVERLRPHVHLNEAHVWSVLDLDRQLELPGLPAGLMLVDGTAEDVASLERLHTTVTRREALRRLAHGAQLWLVKDGAVTAFAAWIFAEVAPVAAAPRGQLRLAPGDVVLEDTATAEEYRGRGIAPAAWQTIARRLREDGYRRMLIKVELDNGASRRAVEKAGFVKAATVDVLRIGPRTRVRVTPVGDVHIAEMLGQRLR